METTPNMSDAEARGYLYTSKNLVTNAVAERLSGGLRHYVWDTDDPLVGATHDLTLTCYKRGQEAAAEVFRVRMTCPYDVTVKDNGAGSVAPGFTDDSQVVEFLSDANGVLEVTFTVGAGAVDAHYIIVETVAAEGVGNGPLPMMDVLADKSVKA